MKINSKLKEIVESKKREIVLEQKHQSIKNLQELPQYQRHPFSLVAALPKNAPFVIAEFKRKSPAKGILNPHANLEELVNAYQDAGATAVSVLSDEPYFAGSKQDIIHARQVLDIPLLRKDFIIDRYQIHQTKALGADLILLIAAILTPGQVQEFAIEARSIGLEVILEIHDSEELLTLDLKPISILGINNRNLNTFITDYQHSLNIAADLPEDIPRISESGISDPSIAARLFKNGYQGFLIGEHFMRQAAPGKACQSFLADLNSAL